MKKILIVVFLLQNWSVFAQTQVKLNLGAFIYKRTDVSIEQRKGHCSIGLTGEYSKPDMNIIQNNVSNTQLSHKQRFGYGGDIRYYFGNETNKIGIFIGAIGRFNFQKFEFKNLIFQRNEKFIGLSTGFKIRLNEHFFLETSGAFSFLSNVKFKDVSRNFDIKKATFSTSDSIVLIDLDELNQPFYFNTDYKGNSSFRFMGNLAIIYQF